MILKNNIEALTRIKYRYLDNMKGFFYEHRYYIALLFVAGYMDFVSTVYFMEKASIMCELHPFIREMALGYGIVLGTILAKIIQVVVGIYAVIYFRPIAKGIFLLATVTYTWAAFFNFMNF